MKHIESERRLPNSFCHSMYFNHWNLGIWKMFPRKGRPRGPGGRRLFALIDNKTLVMRYTVNKTNRDWMIDSEDSDRRAGNRETRRSMVGQYWNAIVILREYWYLIVKLPQALKNVVMMTMEDSLLCKPIAVKSGSYYQRTYRRRQAHTDKEHDTPKHCNVSCIDGSIFRSWINTTKETIFPCSDQARSGGDIWWIYQLTKQPKIWPRFRKRNARHETGC